MKLFKLVLLAVVVNAGMYAEDTVKDFAITPFLNYEYLSFEGQRIHSPGGGILFTKGNGEPPLQEERNSLSLAGTYQQYFIQEAEAGYPNVFHDIMIMAAEE